MAGIAPQYPEVRIQQAGASPSLEGTGKGGSGSTRLQALPGRFGTVQRDHVVGLVEECLRFAKGAGYKSMTLWTQDYLSAARGIYSQAGFKLIASEPNHSFGVDLISETWERDL